MQVITCQICIVSWPKKWIQKPPPCQWFATGSSLLLLLPSKPRLSLTRSFWILQQICSRWFPLWDIRKEENYNLYNAMEDPFHSNTSFLQPFCYILKSIYIEGRSKLLATDFAREEGETEHTGSFSTAVSTSSLRWQHCTDLYSSLGSFPVGLVHMTTDQKKTLGGRSGHGFVTNSTCKTRQFLRSLWSGQGVRAHRMQQRSPGEGRCLTAQQGFIHAKNSLLVFDSCLKLFICERTKFVTHYSCQNIWPLKSRIPAVYHSRNFMYLFLIEVSETINQPLSCCIPFELLQRTDSEKWTNFSREGAHHRWPSVGIKAL